MLGYFSAQVLRSRSWASFAGYFALLYGLHWLRVGFLCHPFSRETWIFPIWAMFPSFFLSFGLSAASTLRAGCLFVLSAERRHPVRHRPHDAIFRGIFLGFGVGTSCNAEWIPLKYCIMNSSNGKEATRRVLWSTVS